MSWLLRGIEPRVDVALLPDYGERVIDQVQRHWVASVGPVVLLVLGGSLFVASSLVNGRGSWVSLLAALGLAAYALFRLVAEYRDRFVITNHKVFRMHGVFDTQRASMPLTKILDITVQKPLLGRLCNYGHFVFESAAQDQGLREIRFVPRIDDRARTIDEVINWAGLRQTAGPEKGDGT